MIFCVRKRGKRAAGTEKRVEKRNKCLAFCVAREKSHKGLCKRVLPYESNTNTPQKQVLRQTTET